jgi:predicted nucleotidyltransferase
MTPHLNVTSEQRELLLGFLRQYLPRTAVWAYGSRVKGTSRAYSDLDLVLFASAEQRPRVCDLKDALAESNLPFLVDVHVWDEVPERFHEIIRKEYVELQEASHSDAWQPGI